MKIEWNKVTSLSQAISIILFISVFFIGFAIGILSGEKNVTGDPDLVARYTCEEGKKVKAVFYENFVYIKSNNIDSYLPRTISASGVRFANKDESLVFWNKGDGAFVQSNGDILIDNCVLIEKSDTN